MDVDLEIFFLRIRDGEVLYRVGEEDVTQSRAKPMETVKRLAGREAGDGDEAVYVHSSSWRYEAPSRVVLTYVAYSERFHLEDGRRMPLADLDAREGRSEEKDNGERDVVAHGVGHLAFLVRSGEAEEARRTFSDEAHKAIRR